MAEHTLGRNDLCPFCGKKFKRCGGHHGSGRRAVVGLLVLVGLGMAGLAIAVVYWQGFWAEKLVRPTPLELAALRAVVDQYVNIKPEDQWWFTDYPPRTEQFGQFIARTETVEMKVEELVQRYRGVSPLAQEIADTFPRFYVSVYTQGLSARLQRGTVAEALLPGPDRLEVCFISQREMGAHPSALYYKPEWRALMIAGVEWPDAALAAFLYHELGHALRHRQGAVSATARPGSDLYDDEEIAMHLLEADVLNAATGGQLFAKHVGAIITRFPVARDWRQAVLKLRADDLEQLDTLLGCRQSGRTVAGSLIAEYLFILGMTAIPVMPQAAYQQEQRACYRWLRSSLME